MSESYERFVGQRVRMALVWGLSEDFAWESTVVHGVSRDDSGGGFIVSDLSIRLNTKHILSITDEDGVVWRMVGDVEVEKIDRETVIDKVKERVSKFDLCTPDGKLPYGLRIMGPKSAEVGNRAQQRSKRV